MKRYLVTALAALSFVAPATAQATTTVPVLMHDPGCHWFYVGGTYKTRLVEHSPVRIQNFDESTLIIKNAGRTELLPVGKSITLNHGVYKITMVHQAPNDNHLKLIIN